MKNYSCIIPVAGLSSRMGSFKPLLPVNGMSMIEHTVQSVIQAGIETIVVVVGFKADQVKEALKRFQHVNIVYIHNHDFETNDMIDSIKLGMNYLIDQPFDASFILPGDMPKINPFTFKLVAGNMTQHQSLVSFPTLNQKRKHPPLISKQCFETIMGFHDDGGLRSALECFAERTTAIEIKNMGYPYDADTDSEYKRLVEARVSFLGIL